MPSTVNSQTPFKPVKWAAILLLVGGAVGYLVGSGAFDSTATGTTSPPACTTPATSTTPQR